MTLSSKNVYNTKATNFTPSKINKSIILIPIDFVSFSNKTFVFYGRTKTRFYKQVKHIFYTVAMSSTFHSKLLQCHKQNFETILLQTFLPSLEELIATHNQLVALEQDFHGLPVLCWADLSYNQIRTISKELVEKTQCQLHGVNRTLNIYLNGE